MIKNNLMGMVFIFTIAVSANIAFANEGCEANVSLAATPAKSIEAPTSDAKSPKVCETKTVPPIESRKIGASTDTAQQQTTSEPGKNIVYFGAGVSRKSDDFDYLEDEFSEFSDNNTAFTVGYLRVSNKSRLLGGVDISYEGTMLDGTYGSYSTRGAFSFNGLVGVNVAKNDTVRLDVAGLIGARENTTDCPSSYLGYACYADMEPSRSYSVNYGGVLAFSYKKLVLGARVTGASTQGLVGIRF